MYETYKNRYVIFKHAIWEDFANPQTVLSKRAAAAEVVALMEADRLNDDPNEVAHGGWMRPSGSKSWPFYAWI